MSVDDLPCGKQFYATEREARAELRRIAAKYPPKRKKRMKKHPHGHYPCKRCGGYHLTSQRKQRPQ